MNPERELTYTLETLRQENDRDHKEIILKLTTLCTTATVNQTRIASLESFRDEHEADHKNDSRTAIAYFIGFLMLGLGVVADWILKK